MGLAHYIEQNHCRNAFPGPLPARIWPELGWQAGSKERICRKSDCGVICSGVGSDILSHPRKPWGLAEILCQPATWSGQSQEAIPLQSPRIQSVALN